MHLRKTGPVNVDWVHLPWNRRQRWAPVKMVMNLRVSESQEFHVKPSTITTSRCIVFHEIS